MAAEPKLARYRAKRDFSKTAEPAGAEKTNPSNRLRFVIQKHAASRLHYDFRLELDGVFRSWAVTRGPSLDPHDRRLAVEVEDHPLDYGDFEGTIPPGQYGGGTVMLWDRGYWEPEPGTDPHEGLKRGDFKFVLDGERLKGGFVLVRMKRREREKTDNWLLIKHHDGYSVEVDGERLTEEAVTSVASGRTMEEIAAGEGKGAKPFMSGGRARASGKAVWNSRRDDDPPPTAPLKSTPAPKLHKPPKLKDGGLPDFVPPQLAKSVDRPPQGAGWAHEIKFDGYRLQLRVEGGAAVLRTRRGLDWTARFMEIAKDAEVLPDCIIDGEACALDANGSPDFPALQAALSDGKTADLVFFAFDLLFAAGEDLRGLPLRERKARLEALLETAGRKLGPRIRFVHHFEAAGDAVLQSACRMSLEGIVSKRLDAAYRSDRSDSWVKAKCRAGHEVVIGGWTGEAGQLRSLLVGVHRGDRLVYVGRVGTGFGRDTVAQVLPRLTPLESDQSPFIGPDAPKKAANVHWARPELVAEIEFAGFTGDGMVRQGAFKGLREDKAADQVVADAPAAVGEVEVPEPQPQPQPKPAPKPAAKPKATDNVVMGLVISNPDKALWPAGEDGGDAPVTKLDLARYLEAVGPWMIAHVKGRPCSIVRTPDGILGKQRFFQRHAGKGSSALISEVRVFGDHKPYLQADRIEALIALAQAAAVEFHPWNCQPFQPETPGRLVFDLDPDEAIPFERVIEAALEVKARLEAVGLTAFCKTTGGKGLHVVTPLAVTKGKGQMDWPTAKTFAQDVCLAIAADAPDRYVVNMAKAKRVGRIFLDYLRNDRLSTAVAPLSPRARPGAPVSFPLVWSQVKPGLNPKAFTLRTAPALLKKTKAWADYCDGERPLAEAISKLKRS
jgi:bifunctional non-homologous end joining protein LigD